MRILRKIQPRRAFTLVEVVLAILIISGIMTVLLYFYQRAAHVRQAALKETDYITTARMLIEQITAELRSARPAPEQFFALEGTSNSISFVCTALPAITHWLVDTNGPLGAPPATDLKKVHYSLSAGTNLFEARGIDRSEEFLGLAGPLGTNTASTNFTAATNELTEAGAFLAARDFAATNRMVVTGQPLTDEIRFMRFRYWDGAGWTNTWAGLDLPAGVEITLGREPMPAEAAAEGYPYEIFRRVVFLPGSIHPANREPETVAEEAFWP